MKQFFFRFLFGGMLFSLSFCAFAATMESNTSTTSISGARLRAAAVALTEFTKRSYDLTNYQILICEKSGDFEVSFVPNIPPGEETIRGGENSNGREIVYLISSSGKIKKISYAK